MKRIGLCILAFSLFSSIWGQNKKDVEAIKSMCGCYEVTFRYAETFQYGADSAYVASKSKREKALEWVQLVEDDEKKISMQHLLIVGKKGNEHIIKHWRQDWLFQNNNFYTYHFDNQWNFSQKPKTNVKGQWTQKVFQVDDSPRYEASATWVHVDGKSFWESAVDAPLPRREDEIRSDYNVLFRRNRHEITDYGWLHEQDNDKVLRRNGKDDLVIAQEKGYNTYKKIADEKCKPAQDFWQKYKDKWAIVRAEWNEIYKRNSSLKLASKVEGKTLFDYLFDEENYKTRSQIKEIISNFVEK